jgi:hypothetical protein
MLDPIQYEFRFVQNTLADPEPKLRYSGSSQKFQLHVAPAPVPQHWLNEVGKIYLQRYSSIINKIPKRSLYILLNTEATPNNFFRE